MIIVFSISFPALAYLGFFIIYLLLGDNKENKSSQDIEKGKTIIEEEKKYQSVNQNEIQLSEINKNKEKENEKEKEKILQENDKSNDKEMNKENDKSKAVSKDDIKVSNDYKMVSRIQDSEANLIKGTEENNKL